MGGSHQTVLNWSGIHQTLDLHHAGRAGHFLKDAHALNLLSVTQSAGLYQLVRVARPTRGLAGPHAGLRGGALRLGGGQRQ